MCVLLDQTKFLPGLGILASYGILHHGSHLGQQVSSGWFMLFPLSTSVCFSGLLSLSFLQSIHLHFHVHLVVNTSGPQIRRRVRILSRGTSVHFQPGLLVSTTLQRLSLTLRGCPVDDLFSCTVVQAQPATNTRNRSGKECA